MKTKGTEWQDWAESPGRTAAIAGIYCLSCVASLTLPGCGEPNGGVAAGRALRPPKEPPIPRAERVEPLDPALRAAAVQELAALRQAPDPGIRAHALEAEREVLGAERASDYIEALGDPEPIVRFSAAMAVGDLKLAAARPILLSRAEDKDARVRIAIRFALHRIGMTAYSHDLEHTAHDTDPGVRGSTAMVLGRLGEKSAVAILRTMRLDPNPAVRQQAGEGLLRLGDEQGQEDMIGLIASQYPDDQMFGILALASANDNRVREHVRVGLVSDYQEVKLVAARAYAMLGGSNSDLGFVVALEGAKGDNPRQKILAAVALGAIGRTDAQPFLAPLLKDPDPDVRVAAAQGILGLAPPEVRSARRH